MYLKICPVLISPIANSRLTSYDPWNPNDTFCFEGIQSSVELTLKNYTKTTHSCTGNAKLDRSTPIDRDTCLSSLGRTEKTSLEDAYLSNTQLQVLVAVGRS